MPTLYCKPARDGGVGDCPFTHMVRFALDVAGQSYVLEPTAKADKPAWLVERHGGSMPCLAPDPTQGEGAVSESSVIAAAVLPPTDIDDASLRATASLFGAIAKFVKNTDDAKDDELRENVDAQLSALEKRLADLEETATAAPLLSGLPETPGVADCSVATKLYVLSVAGKHYKGYDVSPDRFPRVAAYMQQVFDHPAFAKTKYDPDEMIYGWGQARSGGH